MHCRVRLWVGVLILLIAAVLLLQLSITLQYLQEDADLLPVSLRPSEPLRRLYLTGPTQRRDSLLTMFTTFKEQSEGSKLHQVTLDNWCQFLAYNVQPVLFTAFTNVSLLARAQQLGWDILALNRTNRYGMPYIRDLYTAAYHLYASDFYMYANGDILFDQTLVDTLRALQHYAAGSSHLQPLYVVGMRTNIPVDVLHPPPFSSFRLVAGLVKKEPANDVFSMDYFITGRHQFPWQRVPDVVVGRMGYDVHLLTMAMRSGLVTVDVTRTLHAVHLKGLYQHPMLKTANIKDNLYNHLVLGGWDLQQGRVNRTEYLTDLRNGSIVLNRRTGVKYTHT